MYSLINIFTMTMTITKTKTRTKVAVAVAVAVVAGAIAAAGFMLILGRMVPIFALAASSPSGVSVPGHSEVLRYSVAPQRVNIEVGETLFEINTTDNAGSLWNTCDQLGSTSEWAIYDTGGNRVDASGAWQFFNDELLPCVGSETVAFARATFPSMIRLPNGGAAQTFSLYIDTYAASAVSDDSIMVSIPSIASAVSWSDDRGIMRGARGIRSLPIVGNTITY
jgi:hypothetical protein